MVTASAHHSGKTKSAIRPKTMKVIQKIFRSTNSVYSSASSSGFDGMKESARAHHRNVDCSGFCAARLGLRLGTRKPDDHPPGTPAISSARSMIRRCRSMSSRCVLGGRRVHHLGFVIRWSACFSSGECEWLAFWCMVTTTSSCAVPCQTGTLPSRSFESGL